MNSTNTIPVELYEVSIKIIPEPGVTIDQALKDANPQGYESLEIDRANNCATVVLFKRKEQ